MEDNHVSNTLHEVDTLALVVPGSVGRHGRASGSVPC